MTKVWKIVIIAALVLLAVGVLLGGAGFLTGASAARVWSVVSQRLQEAETGLRQYRF